MTENPEEVPMATYRLVCHTAECVNEGAPIELVMPQGGAAMCGPCGQPISDVTHVGPAPEGG